MSSKNKIEWDKELEKAHAEGILFNNLILAMRFQQKIKELKRKKEK